MNKLGLLVDYQWCTGCHSCEIACQMENKLPVGQYGIKVCEVGPWQYGGEEDGGGASDAKWQYGYIPVLTDQCTLCATRLAKGKLPTCVKHCQSQCIKLVSAEQASNELALKRKQMFITI